MYICPAQTFGESLPQCLVSIQCVLDVHSRLCFFPLAFLLFNLQKVLTIKFLLSVLVFVHEYFNFVLTSVHNTTSMFPFMFPHSTLILGCILESIFIPLERLALLEVFPHDLPRGSLLFCGTRGTLD